MEALMDGRARYVVMVVGLPPGEVVHAMAAPSSVEVVLCRDAVEATVWLEGSRTWSALLLGHHDHHDHGYHRLAEAARRRSVPVVAAGPSMAGDGPLGWTDVLATLRYRGTPVRSGHDLTRCGAALASLRGDSSDRAVEASAGPAPTEGSIVAVCGPGGSGASTVAMAVAAGLATPAGPAVVLADLALRPGQAVLHGLPPSPAGLEELVHVHRGGPLSPFEAQNRTVAPGDRPYRLLLGLQRPCHWTAIRPLAFDAALQSLCRAFSVVVADVTGDLEGEATTGSTDVEERNHMARRCTSAAHVVVVVGTDGPTGRRALDDTVEAVRHHAGPGPATITVVNRARGDVGADAITLGRLTETDDVAAWGRPITEAVKAALGPIPELRPSPGAGPASAGPVLVVPGSIGQWRGAR